MKRFLIGACIVALAFPAMAQSVTQTGSVIGPNGMSLGLQPTTQFNQSCNSGLGGIVGQSYSAVLCGPPPATGGSGSNVAITAPLGSQTAAASVATTVNGALPAGSNAIGSITNTSFGVTGALPAGANLIGKVGIDQTTPGTTNGVVINGPLDSFTHVATGLFDATTGSAVSLVTGTSGTPAGGVASVQGPGTSMTPLSTIPTFSNNSTYGFPVTNSFSGSGVFSLSRTAGCNFVDTSVTAGSAVIYLFVIDAASLPADGTLTMGFGSGQLLWGPQVQPNQSFSISAGTAHQTLTSGATVVTSSTPPPLLTKTNSSVALSLRCR